MNEKTRAQRGLRRASKGVIWQGDTEGNTPALALRQDHLARRFGISALHAAVLAELAFPAVDHWRGT